MFGFLKKKDAEPSQGRLSPLSLGTGLGGPSSPPGLPRSGSGNSIMTTGSVWDASVATQHDLCDYPSVGGYPLSATHIRQLRRIWARFTVDLGEEERCIYYRYVSAFVVTAVEDPILAMMVPPETTLRDVIDKVYRDATRGAPLPGDPTEMLNLKIPFMQFMYALFPYLLAPYGYDEMEFSSLEQSFKGVMDGIKPKKDNCEPIETNRPDAIYPAAAVPITAVFRWWSTQGKGKESPWKVMKLREKDMKGLILQTFEKQTSQCIDFFDYWIMENKTSPMVEEKRAKRPQPDQSLSSGSDPGEPVEISDLIATAPPPASAPPPAPEP